MIMNELDIWNLAILHLITIKNLPFHDSCILTHDKLIDFKQDLSRGKVLIVGLFCGVTIVQMMTPPVFTEAE